MSVATIVIQISLRVLSNKIYFLSLWNVLAYRVYDRSYARSMVVVQATGCKPAPFFLFIANRCKVFIRDKCCHLPLCLRLMVPNSFFPIHCTYLCIRRTDGATRMFYFLSLSLPERVTLWSRIIPVHVTEREERRRKKKKKEEEEKSPEKTTLSWPGFEPMDSVSRTERAIH